MTSTTAAAAQADSFDPERFRETAAAIETQIERVIVGQREAIRGVLICLIADGHALLEGVPGLGKTTMVRAFAEALNLTSGRVQFTPDLMPADITGTTIFTDDPVEGLRSQFHRGPVFSSILLADEINRASPRTQSALLEAMQEATVTVAGETHELPRPFCVLATQNPVEMHGTYPLPEAQLDRFLLKLQFEFPSATELLKIMSEDHEGTPEVDRVADGGQLIAMHQLAKQVPVATSVLEHVASLILALQPSPQSPEVVREYVRLGPSPRGALALTIAGRITALLEGRHNLALDDIRAVAFPALRHRVALNFDAEREGVNVETVISAALDRLAE
jgi:MoxR-like ATPase